MAAVFRSRRLMPSSPGTLTRSALAISSRTAIATATDASSTSYSSSSAKMKALLAMLPRPLPTPHISSRNTRLLVRAFHTNGKSTADAEQTQINRLLCEVRTQLGVAMIGAATAALDMDMRAQMKAASPSDSRALSTASAAAFASSKAPVHSPDNQEFVPRKWQLFGQIGAGSFGTVHIGMCEDSGQVAAVKIVRPNKQTFSTLEREIKTLEFVRAVGGHRSIIELYDVYIHDRAVFLVTELVRGGELYDFVAANGALSEETARSMMTEMADALRFLHQYGVVHRDIKPENILLTHRSSRRSSSANDTANANSNSAVPSLHVKLADFGSAGPSHAALRLDEVGTSAYLAPEVLRDGVCTTACDMWALGCVLYIALSGAHPFDLDGTATDREVEHRARSMPVVFDFAAWQDVSDDAKNLIAWLLAKDPNDRPTADQVLMHPWIRGRKHEDNNATSSSTTTTTTTKVTIRIF